MPQITNGRARPCAEEQNLPDGGAASPHQGAPAASRDAQVVTLGTGVLVPELEGSVHPSTGRQATGDPGAQGLPAASCRVLVSTPRGDALGTPGTSPAATSHLWVGIGDHLHVLIYALHPNFLQSKCITFIIFLKTLPVLSLIIPPGTVVGVLI